MKKLVVLFLCLNVFCSYAQNEKFKVVFSGGYETDPRDDGRPVVLIANALGVTPEVFRHAFSLMPASQAGNEPEEAYVKKKKASLLSVLAPYGITNDSLDRVSDYYRYADVKGQVWKRKPAKALAIVTNGKVTGIKLLDGGNGYTSAPVITVTNSEVKIKATIAFSKDFKKNGRVDSLRVE